jgi:cell wall-associated NlpC family hydrolase
VPHASTVLASPCAGTDGWAILAEPPGVRDLEDPRYWETSLERSLRRRGTRPVRFTARPQLQVAAALALTAVAAPAAAGASTLDLSRGASGDAVRRLQTKLGIAADGAFGPQTDAAVRAFQRSHGLPVTGLVGPLTRAALGVGGAASTPSGEDTSSSTAVTAGASQVRALQRSLGVAVDGIVGPQTRAAIKAFESAHGLPVTGEPDAATLSAVGVGDTPTTPADQTDGTSTTPPASAPAPAASSKAATAVQAAMSKVGSSYSYGATGPSSFDCSGLVMYALRQAGVSVPHSSYAQYGLGQSVSGDQIQAGDLVFFNTAGSGASDVGIATSPGTAVSATTHGVMTHSIRSGYWGSHFVGARRVV